ncbi:hypothetical protein [Marivita sp. S6314]|nr:hypothetical protein [Marivita sp. S6314]
MGFRFSCCLRATIRAQAAKKTAIAGAAKFPEKIARLPLAQTIK